MQIKNIKNIKMIINNFVQRLKHKPKNKLLRRRLRLWLYTSKNNLIYLHEQRSVALRFDDYIKEINVDIDFIEDETLYLYGEIISKLDMWTEVRSEVANQ